MENTQNTPNAAEASAALADAEASRTMLAQRISMPSWFFTSIGVAIAVQIASGAVGIAGNSPWTLAALVAGTAALLAVAGVQLWRFRQQNGVWLGGLLSRVVLGTGTLVSVSYMAAFGGATWAAFDARWWLVAIWSIIGGAAYALNGRRWLRAYSAEPALHANAESLAALALIAVSALAFLALLLISH